MDLEPVFTRYANDPDFNAKVRAAFAAVDASPYTTVKHAVLAIALDAAFPAEPAPEPGPEPLKSGDRVIVLPDAYCRRSGKLYRCTMLATGETCTVKNPNPDRDGNISVMPYWVILPEYVERVDS